MNKIIKNKKSIIISVIVCFLAVIGIISTCTINSDKIKDDNSNKYPSYMDIEEHDEQGIIITNYNDFRKFFNIDGNLYGECENLTTDEIDQMFKTSLVTPDNIKYILSFNEKYFEKNNIFVYTWEDASRTGNINIETEIKDNCLNVKINKNNNKNEFSPMHYFNIVPIEKNISEFKIK